MVPKGPPSTSWLTVGENGRRLRLVGTHNIYNALAAVAVGLERGLSLAEVVRALASWFRRTNAVRSSKWATSRSSTIVTIPIQRL